MGEEIAQFLQSRYAIDEEGEARLFESLPFASVSPCQPSTSVGLSQIRSLVCRGKGSMPGTSYLVPGFAVHWALVIRHTLFHLRYFPKVAEKRVRFTWCDWEEDMKREGHEIEVIGSTGYNTDQLIEIGIHQF
jgi:hypothetical protein